MSDQRRYHEANAGRDSKPVIFIFEGNNVLWMLAGVGVALLVFRLTHGRLQWSLGESFAAGLVPLVLVTLYVVVLKSGKPKSYDGEFFEWGAHQLSRWLDRIGLKRAQPYFAPCRCRNRIPYPFPDNDNEENRKEVDGSPS